MLKEWIALVGKNPVTAPVVSSGFTISLRSANGTIETYRTQSLPPLLSHDGRLFLPTQSMGTTYEEVKPTELTDIDFQAIETVKVNTALGHIKNMTEGDFKELKRELDLYRK